MKRLQAEADALDKASRLQVGFVGSSSAGTPFRCLAACVDAAQSVYSLSETLHAAADCICWGPVCGLMVCQLSDTADCPALCCLLHPSACIQVAQEQLAEYATEKSTAATAILQQAEALEATLQQLLAGSSNGSADASTPTQVMRHGMAA